MTLRIAYPAPTGVPLSTVDERADLAANVVRNAAGVPRAGVMPRNIGILGQPRASMGVDMLALEAILVRNGLPQWVINDGTVTVPIGAAPGANERFHIVYLKQNETASPFSDPNNNLEFGVAIGPAAAVPNKAAALALVPAGGLPILSVRVPFNAVTTQSAGVILAAEHPFTSLAGSPFWVRTRGDLPASMAHNTEAKILDTNTEVYYDAVTSIWKKKGLGLVPIIPTSVAGTGVVKGDDGAITFTSSPSISVNGAFTAEYDNYLVIFNIDGTNGAAGGSVRMRNAGVDNGAGAYTFQNSWVAGASFNGQRIGLDTQFSATPVAAAEFTNEYRFFNPAKALPTRWKADVSAVETPSIITNIIVSGRHNVGSAHDGFSYTTSGGALVTGTMRIYGYNNN